jgi:hypothetical protein
MIGLQQHAYEGRDEWKVVFHMNHSLFEPLVMFFGLTNSPSTFQTMMNDIFQDLIMEGIICVYLDDILIFTKSIDEHHRITQLILTRLYEQSFSSSMTNVNVMIGTWSRN